MEADVNPLKLEDLVFDKTEENVKKVEDLLGNYIISTSNDKAVVSFEDWYGWGVVNLHPDEGNKLTYAAPKHGDKGKKKIIFYSSTPEPHICITIKDLKYRLFLQPEK